MSISQQIREVLAKAPEPLNIAQLLELCDEAQTTTDVAAACYAMTKAGTLERERPEGGPYQYRLASGSPPADPDAGDDPEPSEPRAPRARKVPARMVNNVNVSGAVDKRAQQQIAGEVGRAVKRARVTIPSTATSPAVADLQIAITEAGILALRRGEVVMYLSSDEQARIEAFSQRFRIVN